MARLKDRRDQIVYGRTLIGQILYDLAFTNLSEKYLARKYRKPIADVRRLRNNREIRKLRRQNGLRAVLSVAVLFVAYGVTARAADSCLSFAQARAVFPNVHLWWHKSNSGRCWDASGPGSARASAGRANRLPVPVPAPPFRAEIYYPTLIVSDPVVELQAEPMERAPRLIDVDADPTLVDANGNAQRDLDSCCWPVVEISFRERWESVPSYWFVKLER